MNIEYVYLIITSVSEFLDMELDGRNSDHKENIIKIDKTGTKVEIKYQCLKVNDIEMFDVRRSLEPSYEQYSTPSSSQISETDVLDYFLEPKIKKSSSRISTLHRDSEKSVISIGTSSFVEVRIAKNDHRSTSIFQNMKQSDFINIKSQII